MSSVLESSNVTFGPLNSNAFLLELEQYFYGMASVGRDLERIGCVEWRGKLCKLVGALFEVQSHE